MREVNIMSKRIDQTLSVITNTANLVRNEIAYIDCVPVAVAESLCDKAISETADRFHVTQSAVLSKCTREIGIKSKYDFFLALIEFITCTSNRLMYALINHDCSDDGEWYIEHKLNSLVA